MASQEFLARVQELYVAYYGRPADQEGQQYWADRIDAEGESAIINAFGNSAEYEAMAEGQGNATLVDNLYQQMFGRSADPEGLTYYTGVLESGEKSLAEIATTILNAASGVDRNDFNAKVEAAAEYTAEFGSADDYDIVAAQDVVENAEGGLYTPELTPAIEDYQGAQEAVSDYLQDTVASNETVAEALDDEPTDGEIETALSEAIRTEDGTGALTGGAEYDVNQAGDNLTLSQDASVAAAQIAAQQEAYAEAVDEAEATVAETEGLQGAINSLQTAETRYESALKAEIETSQALAGEAAKATALNSDALAADASIEADTTAGDSTLASIDDGAGNTSDFLVVDGGEVVLDSSLTASDYEGLDALIATAQEQYDAEQAVSKQETALTEAGNKVADLDDTTDSVTFTDTDGEVDVNFTAATDATDGSDAESLINAQTAVENFDEAVADYQELTALQDQVDDLNDTVDDAEVAIEEQGVTLGTFADGEQATSDADLFIFDNDEASVELGSTTSFAGEDQIYVGDSYTAVEVGSDEVLADDALGDSGVLEVFFGENTGGDAVLSFENETFAGSATGVQDLTQVTLTGVSVDDLQLDNGYIAVA